MKKGKYIIYLIIGLLLAMSLTTVNATSGKLKKDSIIYCNYKRYGTHGKNNHWHQSTSTNYATGPVLRVPCGLDNIKITNSSSTYAYNKITFTKINNISGYIIYRSSSKGYIKIATTKNNYYKDTNAIYGKGYYYKVKGYKKIGSKIYYGKSSKAIYAKKVLNKGVIPKLESTTDTITLKLTKVYGATGNKIYRGFSVEGPYKFIKTTTLNEYIDKNLESDTAYYYKIKPYRIYNNKVIYGDYSSTYGIRTKSQEA